MCFEQAPAYASVANTKGGICDSHAAEADSTCLTMVHGMQVLAAGACSPDEPGPGCPCTPVEGSPSGACAAGYQCATESQLGRTTLHNAPGNNSVGMCIPCSLGQYCPRGAVLPLPGSREASLYVIKYACRCAAACWCLFSPAPTPPQLHCRCHISFDKAFETISSCLAVTKASLTRKKSHFQTPRLMLSAQISFHKALTLSKASHFAV